MKTIALLILLPLAARAECTCHCDCCKPGKTSAQQDQELETILAHDKWETDEMVARLRLSRAQFAFQSARDALQDCVNAAKRQGQTPASDKTQSDILKAIAAFQSAKKERDDAQDSWGLILTSEIMSFYPKAKS